MRFWRGSKVGSVGGSEVGGGDCIVVTEYNRTDYNTPGDPAIRPSFIRTFLVTAESSDCSYVPCLSLTLMYCWEGC